MLDGGAAVRVHTCECARARPSLVHRCSHWLHFSDGTQELAPLLDEDPATRELARCAENEQLASIEQARRNGLTPSERAHWFSLVANVPFLARSRVGASHFVGHLDRVLGRSCRYEITGTQGNFLRQQVR